MNIEPRIETLKEKKLVGRRISMKLSNNKTEELWKTFMPRRKEIINSLNTDLFSMQVYNKSLDFKNFNQETEFDKWAVAEVADFNTVPADMETFTLVGGLYAVFIHKGAPNAFMKTFHYIFETWLPNSNFILDNRPHFEILGEKYKHNSPSSEEEVWIPIKERWQH